MSSPLGHVAKEQMTGNAGPARVLIIDDDASFIAIVTKFLQQQGYAVSSASNGEDGLRMASKQVPDLVLCDLEMPGMDGYEVLSQLRQEENIADVPFIFLTGQAQPHQVREGMNLGADDYLSKPFNGEELLRAVKARLSRAQLRKARASQPDERPGGSGTLGLDDSFLVKTSSEMKLIKVRQLHSVVADGEYSWVYWDSGKGALLRKALKQWEAELPPGKFVRIHRRAIINLDYMERLEKTPAGQAKVYLRDIPEPLEVSLRLAPSLNRKLKELAP
jgi:CheY-like chemotaxis protein